MRHAAAKADASRTRAIGIVDCDIHNVPRSDAELKPYLSKRWQRYCDQFGLRGYGGAYYPPTNPGFARRDAWPPTGGPPGSDYAFLRDQLLDEFNVEVGVLNTLYEIGELVNTEFAAAIARAVNDWQVDTWLEHDERFRASLLMPYQNGELAAAEIDRHADDARFVQALVVTRTAEPLGRLRYWPIYEVLEAHDLPLAIHFGGYGGSPVSGVGHASFYIEQHAGMMLGFQEQLTSLVYEGVFERFSRLRVVLIEGGFAWLAPLMWRLDRSWMMLKDEVPHLRMAPSEYIRRHCWVTTQPIDEPSHRAGFQQIIDQLGMDDRLMFATDYPHWDFDSPDQALPPDLSPELRRRLFSGNARALYGLAPDQCGSDAGGEAL